jgi:hypothetical protein
MNKLAIFSIVALSLLVVACAPTAEETYAQKKGVGDTRTGDTFIYEVRETEINQKRLIESTPVPKLQASLERKNIARRLELLNDENRIFYVYLVSYGKVVSYHTAKGKVSSVSSYLTASEQIVADPQCLSRVTMDAEASCYQVVEAPDQDGSYGTNGDGIFFFTTEGAYVEWRGEYMVSDFPLKLSTPPELVRNVQ